MRIFAPAKVNLNLLVGPCREDGFHSIDSLAVRVSLYDEIVLKRREDGKVVLACSLPECGPAESNLAVKAARLLKGYLGSRGVDITLRKGIPVGGGLAGGSSDAAAVLSGLNELWELRLGQERLAAMGESLGSDVPMLLGPPAARMTGRGEQLAPIHVHEFAMILILPGVSCDTRDVYRNFDSVPKPMGSQLDYAVLREAPSTWRRLLINQLLGPAEIAQPVLRKLRLELAGKIAPPVCLSGSGSTMFILCDDLSEAEAVWDAMPEHVRRISLLAEPNPW